MAFHFYFVKTASLSIMLGRMYKLMRFRDSDINPGKVRFFESYRFLLKDFHRLVQSEMEDTIKIDFAYVLY